MISISPAPGAPRFGAAAFPSRIVSLAASNTEILLALGVADRLLGVSKYCDYPAEALEKPRLGSFLNPDYPAIQQIEPDLVLTASHLQREVVAHLADLNINVLSMNPVTLKAVLGSIALVGRTVGCEAQADALVSQMQARIDAVRIHSMSLRRRPRVYFEEWGNPMIPVGGWEAECVEVAGGINVFPFPAHVHSRDRTISSEDVIGANPDMILVAWPGSFGRIRPDKIKQRAGWEKIDAVRNDRVYVIDDRLVVRPGPRVVEGLELIAGFISQCSAETPNAAEPTRESENRAL